MELSPAMQQYVLHWGEMGTRWGVNRTIAQIHALLYLSAQPLTADEIQETLNVARSNVSTSLKELQSWGLVNVIHVLGDRRDHFESKKDLWEMFHIIIRERKRRELDPTLSMLRNCALEANNDKQTDEDVKQRMQAMLDFVETFSDWYEQMEKIPQPMFSKLIKMGAKITGVLTRKR